MDTPIVRSPLSKMLNLGLGKRASNWGNWVECIEYRIHKGFLWVGILHNILWETCPVLSSPLWNYIHGLPLKDSVLQTACIKSTLIHSPLDFYWAERKVQASMCPSLPSGH